MGCIYIATSPSGRSYIGKTIGSFAKRRNEHMQDAKRSSRPICRAIKKYGEQMVWNVLHYDVPDRLLDIAELCAIYVHETDLHGYNCTPGGDGAPHSQETKEKLRLANLGPNNPRFGTVPWNKGKPRTEAEKAKMSAAKKGRCSAFKGKTHSAEAKAKLSAAAKERYASRQRDPEGRFL